MKIPEEKIQEIREATDLVDVISQYVTLKKKGKTFMGLCPFHSEKTPSFSVDPVRGFYHCFGCGAGGNVFSFVMEMEKITFPEALRTLAEKAGIALPSLQERESGGETESLVQANHFAANYFRNALRHPVTGKPANEYLAKRAFEQKTIDAFLIGFAPDSWDGLLNQSRKAGIHPDIMQKAGLIVPRKDGSGHYDRFRGRLMFPILNPSGRIVGFGARILDSKPGQPKYVNTPETPIYKKSQILYGLFLCKNGIRRENKVMLVEGYTDVMRLYEAGFDFAVASSGTALTEEQAGLIARYSKHVVLVYDGDSAGFQAAIRGVDILLNAGLQVEVVPLMKGKDPDSFIRERGGDSMRSLLTHAVSFVDFRLQRYRDQGKLTTPSQKAAAAHQILETVSRIKDPMERALSIKEISEKLGIDEKMLLGEIKREAVPAPQSDFAETISSGMEKAQNGLILLLLENGQRWAPLIFRFLTPDQFHPRIRFLAEEYHSRHREGPMPDPNRLLDRFAQDTVRVKLITSLLSLKLDEKLDRWQYSKDCVLHMIQEQIRLQMDQAGIQIRQLEKEGKDITQEKQKWMELNFKLREAAKEIEETWKISIEI